MPPSATIVTAFFRLSHESSHSLKTYLHWAGRLLAPVRSPMAVTTDAGSIAALRSLREAGAAAAAGWPTHWTVRNLTSLWTERRYHRSATAAAAHAKSRKLDKHGHTVRIGKHDNHYCLLMHEKVALLRAVARVNRFNTTHFLWVDLGMWRVSHGFERWPDAARLQAWPTERVLALEVCTYWHISGLSLMFHCVPLPDCKPAEARPERGILKDSRLLLVPPIRFHALPRACHAPYHARRDAPSRRVRLELPKGGGIHRRPHKRCAAPRRPHRAQVYPFPRRALRRSWTLSDLVVAGRHGELVDPRGRAPWGVLGGGIFGGSGSAVARWASGYFALLDRMAHHSRGAAPALLTDQDVFRRLYLLTPELWALVPSPSSQWCHGRHPILASMGGGCFHSSLQRGCVERQQALAPPCAGTSSSWMYLIAWLASAHERNVSFAHARIRPTKAESQAATTEPSRAAPAVIRRRQDGTIRLSEDMAAACTTLNAASMHASQAERARHAKADYPDSRCVLGKAPVEAL